MKKVRFAQVVLRPPGAPVPELDRGKSKKECAASGNDCPSGLW